MVTAPISSPALFPRLPRQLEVSLKGQYMDQQTGGSTFPANRAYALTEFDTHLPRFAAELYQIYRYARITAVGITMDIVNTSSTQPLYAALAVVPYAEATGSWAPFHYTEMPGSVTTSVGLSSGASQRRIRKLAITDRELGAMTTSGNEFAQTYSQALAAATRIDAPAIVGSVQSETGASWTGVIRYEVVYHIQFYELINTDIEAARAQEESVMEITEKVQPEPRPKLSKLSPPYQPRK